MINPKKLIVGWFTLTCSEDSTILMTELLNTHWQEWTKKIDFKYAKIFRTSNSLGPMDVAFVEGAISSDKQAQKLKSIRSHAKKLVAIGACAVMGQPASQRNQFSDNQNQEIQFILDRFKYSKNVQKVSDLVPVDYSIPGCPMDEAKFLELMKKLLGQTM